MIQIHRATPEQIMDAGIDALVRELGPVGMARFFKQLEQGMGDYTEERQKWAEHVTVDQLVEEIRQMRKEK